jgi:small subunit ribosomal protein S18|tara:strand:+ start:100 stop:372 length:273 start_codon:yes stop_codon:yes gene_type:complete
MKRKNKKFQKRGSNTLSKLSLFQKSDGKFSRKCPLSVKDAPIVDYKNISLLKKYISDNGKIISSKITSVSFGKQKKLTKEIKKAKILGLI